MVRNRSRWRPEEDEYLRRNFARLPIEKMAKDLCRGEKATYNRCYQLGLSKTGCRSSRKRWTQKEKEFLINNYQQLSNRQIGEKLGRSESGVMGMAHRLGIRKKNRGGLDEK